MKWADMYVHFSFCGRVLKIYKWFKYYKEIWWFCDDDEDDHFTRFWRETKVVLTWQRGRGQNKLCKAKAKTSEHLNPVIYQNRIGLNLGQTEIMYGRLILSEKWIALRLGKGGNGIEVFLLSTSMWKRGCETNIYLFSRLFLVVLV